MHARESPRGFELTSRSSMGGFGQQLLKLVVFGSKLAHLPCIWDVHATLLGSPFAKGGLPETALAA